MKFSVGYQLLEGFQLIDKIIEYREDIAEVYFSYGDFPNGRNNQLVRADMTKAEAQQKQIGDLTALANAGIPLNILFNATCYGKDAQSRTFFEKIGDTVDFFKSEYTLKSLTTASPIIARFIKENFNDIEVRASVNMCIGTCLGMEYVSDVFDGFYMRRELNRDFNKIRELRNWCIEHGKRLYALANSGCLNECSAHTFHDNLVSHESEISLMDNGFNFSGVCAGFLKDERNLKRIFECTSFIRPEDVHYYEGLFPSLKLATRVNSNPMRVLDSYIKRQRHVGSTLDLLEPNHTGTIYPYFLENTDIESEVKDGKLIYKNIEKALIRLGEDIYVNK